MLTRYSPRRRRPGRRSPTSRTTGRGGSTPATSAIPTGICGRSSGIPGAPARAPDVTPGRGESLWREENLPALDAANREHVQRRPGVVVEAAADLGFACRVHD